MTKQEFLKTNTSLNISIDINEDKNNSVFNMNENVANISFTHKNSQKENYKISKKKKENQIKKVEIPEFKNSENSHRSYLNLNTYKSNYLSLHKLLQENSLFI